MTALLDYITCLIDGGAPDIGGLDNGGLTVIYMYV